MMLNPSNEEPDCLLSVVIVSYNNYGVLRDCLDSIRTHNDIGAALEVIVVEQSPKCDIYSALIKDYPWVNVMRNQNCGFGAGNNAGARVAKGKYLLLLNPDTVLLEPVFQFAVDKFEENATLGIFGVRLVNLAGERNQSFYFRKPYGLIRCALLWRLCDRFDIFLPNAMYITGADLFVRSDAFTKIGGFDERMFMYFEETYLCTRLNRLGLTVGYFPNKKIVHIEGQSSVSSEVFSRRLDSLAVLCRDLERDYSFILNKMKRDRQIKIWLGSDRDVRSAEITLIDQRLDSLR